MGVSLESLQSLSDEALTVCLGECLSAERRATAQLLAALEEFDSRRLYLGRGFSSLFAYCVGYLHLSERAAYSRIEAARLARRFPIILELVADSRVSLTAIALLARHLNEANYRALLRGNAQDRTGGGGHAGADRAPARLAHHRSPGGTIRRGSD